MNIPGENLNGVQSANEFLTRVNLMKAYDNSYDTPVYVGQRVVVVGGGNVAMDAVRTAARLGALSSIVYRRSEAELPARVEEVHHAKQEGIEFRMLSNPVEILGDEKGWVRAHPVHPYGTRRTRCFGTPFAGGNSRVPNSRLRVRYGYHGAGHFAESADRLDDAACLETNRRGCLVADEEHGQTSREGIFAGGDAVTGAATVILAMGAGRRAARAIDEYVRAKSGMN